MPDIPDKEYSEIIRLSAIGDELIEKCKYNDAILKYSQALALVPEPIDEYEASTWLFAAIGECFFFPAKYTEALNKFQNAVAMPTGLGNPFIHLRLGQCYFELDNQTKAADELTRAYMLAGYDIFESEDKKYFSFLKSKIDAPPEGWLK